MKKLLYRPKKLESLSLDIKTKIEGKRTLSFFQRLKRFIFGK